MDTRHRTPAGALVAQCSDETACTAVSCAVCLKEVPADAIQLAYAQDYVLHFCGLECFERWKRQAATRNRQSS